MMFCLLFLLVKSQVYYSRDIKQMKGATEKVQVAESGKKSSIMCAL